MALLKIPNAMYDYLLYYECASKDWATKNPKSKIGTESAGYLLNHVNWSVTSSTLEGDSGGATKCGITWKTWRDFYNKNSTRYNLTCGAHIDGMDKKGWISYIEHNWNQYAGKAANIACAIIIFQCRWGGWSKVSTCYDELKKNADVEGYNFVESKDIWKNVVDATHAFKNPMKAYSIIRDCHIKYLYDISAPGKKNAQFRTGWMRREIPPFQLDGLYVEPGLNAFAKKNTNGFTLAQWRNLCETLKTTEKKYVKIYDWGETLDEEPINIDDLLLTNSYKNSETNESNNWPGVNLSGNNKKQLNYSGVLLGAHLNQK